MSTYIVEGGCPLEGSVRVHGAKNSVLPILAAINHEKSRHPRRPRI